MSTPTPLAARNDSERRGDLLRQRYRGSYEAAGPWAAGLELLLGRHSTRAYLPTPLPDGLLETLVAAAQSAPTSSNLQALSIVAVTDPDRRQRLAGLAGPNRQIGEAPLLLVFIADLARARRIARRHGQPGDGLDHLESFLVAVIDAALAAQNTVTAAEALGLGTCFIGAMRNQPEAIAAELGLPPEAFAVFGLTVGYPDPARASAIRPRLPQSSVLHRERYGEAAAPDDLGAYNHALRAFQHEQNMPAIDWTEQVSRRIGSAGALKGREQLTAILRRLGFKLI